LSFIGYRARIDARHQSGPQYARDDGSFEQALRLLASGLALVVSDLPDWRTMFVEPGYAVACSPEDPSSVVRVLQALINNPQLVRAMGEKGRQRIELDWNYEAQFRSVCESIA